MGQIFNCFFSILRGIAFIPCGIVVLQRHVGTFHSAVFDQGGSYNILVQVDGSLATLLFGQVMPNSHSATDDASANVHGSDRDVTLFYVWLSEAQVGLCDSVIT